MKIINNAIVFDSGIKVELLPSLHSEMPQYINETVDMFKGDETASQASWILERSNNDGSWTVVLANGIRIFNNEILFPNCFVAKLDEDFHYDNPEHLAVIAATFTGMESAAKVTNELAHNRYWEVLGGVSAYQAEWYTA